MFRWVFENRETGRITIAQMLNLPLWMFLVAWAIRAVLHPSGRVGGAIHLVELIALTIWAVDEVFRGVNPWRRFLGLAGLAYVVSQFLHPGLLPQPS